MSKKRPFSEEVRRLIEESGQTQYKICKATGIQPATMNRFMNRKAGLSMENLDRLFGYLGWKITADTPNRKPRI